jgi:hypothetical protein
MPYVRRAGVNEFHGDATMSLMQSVRPRKAGPITVACALAAMLVPQPGSARVYPDPAVESEYQGCVAKIRAAGFGNVIDKLENSRHGFVIHNSVGGFGLSYPNNESAADNGVSTGATLNWNTNPTGTNTGDVPVDKCANLYHEMNHMAHWQDGTFVDEKNKCSFMTNARYDDPRFALVAASDTHIPIEEVNVTREENKYRQSQGLPPRPGYGGYFLPLDGIDCDPPPPPRPPAGCNGCAISHGEPHLTTFDGAHYDFQAVGEFILTRDSSGDLEVQTRQTAFPGSTMVSFNTAVAANVAGDRVGVYASGLDPELHIGGVATLARTQRLPHGGTISTSDHRAIDIAWPDGSELFVRPTGPWALTVMMHLADSRRGRVEGVLGNFDGNQANDIAVRGGAKIGQPPKFEDLYPRFADSWRVTQSQSLFDYGPDQNTATFTNLTFPARPISIANLQNRSAAETVCRQRGVAEQHILEACVLDVGLTGQAIFATDAATTQALALSGNEMMLAVTQPGTTARLAFLGTAGQKLFVDASSSNVDDCGVLFLLDPDNHSLAHGCIVGGGGFIDLTVLPSTGQYTIVLDPRGRKTGQANLRLITAVDQEGTITANGPEVTAAVNQPGAVARLQFPGTAGQKVFVDATSSTVDDCEVLFLLDPANQRLAHTCILGGKGLIDGIVLPTTGKYTIVLDLPGRKTGQAKLRLRK